MTTAPTPTPRPLPLAVLVSTPMVAVIMCLPAVLIVALRYLPLVDLPQHTAVASIIQHLDDPAFDFKRYYELAPGRTLYYLPYLITWLLAHVVSVEVALRLVVAAATVAVPLGVLAVVRATGRPAVIALLAVPLTFNQAFFFGFHHFLLATGLGFAGYALAISPRWGRGRAALSVLCAIASTTTHVFGTSSQFPFTLQADSDRWQLYRRVDAKP